MSVNIILVYDQRIERWYLAEKNYPFVPLSVAPCQTRDELRWQLGHFNFAVNGPVTWINAFGSVEVEE